MHINNAITSDNAQQDFYMTHTNLLALVICNFNYNAYCYFLPQFFTHPAEQMVKSLTVYDHFRSQDFLNQDETKR